MVLVASRSEEYRYSMPPISCTDLSCFAGDARQRVTFQILARGRYARSAYMTQAASAGC